jgi:hypothetical protein
MVATVFGCSSLVLPDHSKLRREYPRPLEFRQGGYGSEFDDRTLFYDAFRVNSGLTSKVVLLGPPWFNLLPLLQEMRIGSRHIAFIESTMCFRDRCADIWIHAWNSNELMFVMGSENRSIALQPDQSNLYRGKRVLYTLSRNNDIHWIADWARFHVRNHGANGILLYDNNSSRYQPVELEQTLRTVLPDVETNVVRWPYKYGPGGYTPIHWWDSDFCQQGAFQHARFRFLSSAASVLNCDIDELVLSLRGESIFEATEKADLGYTSFGGRWISNASTESARGRESSARTRHSQFRYLERLSEEGPRKWCVVPNKCALSDQWKTHQVSGKDQEKCFSREFSYRHFRAISTNWKYERSERISIDPANHVFDNLLDQAIESAEL